MMDNDVLTFWLDVNGHLINRQILEIKETTEYEINKTILQFIYDCRDPLTGYVLNRSGIELFVAAIKQKLNQLKSTTKGSG